VTDEFAPDLSPIKRSRDKNKKSYLSKLAQRGNKSAKTRKGRSKAHLNLRRQILRYINPHPVSRKLVYSGDLGDPDILSDSDSSTAFESDGGETDGGETEVEAAGDTDYASLVSGSESDESDTEAESDKEPELQYLGYPGGATGGNSPKKKVKSPKAESTLEKVLRKTDEFLFTGYPKRNIPRKNYKE
jgi:hypothetical protein